MREGRAGRHCRRQCVVRILAHTNRYARTKVPATLADCSFEANLDNREMNRDEAIRAVCDRNEPWDVVIIGGGATGLGAGVDAALEGNGEG